MLRLAECYLAFLTHAQDGDGAFHNRLGHDRRWTDEPGLGDWWGRALWGLGTAAARSPAPWIREEALVAFTLGAARRSPRRAPWPSPGSAPPRCCAADPDDRAAAALLADAATAVGAPGTEPGLAVAAPTADLRQRRARRGRHRRRPPARRRSAAHRRPADADLAARDPDCATAGCRSSRSAAGGAARPSAPPRPAADRGRRARRRLRHRRRGRPATPAGTLGVRQAIAWFLGDNDVGTADVGPRHRRRLRRADPARAQPQPGRRVDPRPHLHPAARPRTGMTDETASTHPRPDLATRLGHTLTPDPRRVIVKLFVPGEDAVLVRTRAHALIERIAELDDDETDAPARTDPAPLRRPAPRPRGHLPAPLRPGPPPGGPDQRAVTHGPPAGRRLLQPRVRGRGRRAVQSVHGGAPRPVRARTPVSCASRSACARSARDTSPRSGSPPPSSGPATGSPSRTGPARWSPAAAPAPGTGATCSPPGWPRKAGTTRSPPPCWARCPNASTTTPSNGRLGHLPADLLTRATAQRTLEQLRRTITASYAMTFPADVPLHQRVLWPATPAESNGMEDARFVRCVDDDGGTAYQATYTAYDGRHDRRPDAQQRRPAPLPGDPDARTGRPQQGHRAVPASGRRSTTSRCAAPTARPSA